MSKFEKVLTGLWTCLYNTFVLDINTFFNILRTNLVETNKQPPPLSSYDTLNSQHGSEHSLPFSSQSTSIAIPLVPSLESGGTISDSPADDEVFGIE